jgi:hypothetical protein
MTRRSMAVLLVGTVLLGFIVSCASTTSETKWEGRKIDEAIAKLGPPTRIDVSNTGKTYVWEWRREMTGMGGVPGSTREVRVTIRMMTVDANGVITSYTRVDQ